MKQRALVLFASLALAGAAAAQQTPPPAAPAPTPAPAEATLEQFLAGRGWAAVPLRENEFNQLEADMLVNGQHKLRVQISTSFSKTIIDEAVAKQLGLAIEPSGIEITGAKKQRLGTLRLDSLAFGDTAVGAATVFTADLSALLNRPTAETGVQGVIGSDLLTRYQAVLEIPSTKLYLRVR
jgi:hypothetical protein